RRREGSGQREFVDAELRRRLVCTQGTVAVRDRSSAISGGSRPSRRTTRAGKGTGPASPVRTASGAGTTRERPGKSTQSSNGRRPVCAACAAAGDHATGLRQRETE